MRIFRREQSHRLIVPFVLCVAISANPLRAQNTSPAPMTSTSEIPANESTLTELIANVGEPRSYSGGIDSTKPVDPGVREFVPQFVPTRDRYALQVSQVVETVRLTPVAKDPAATITINGAPAKSGEETAPIALSAGRNLIAVQVTARDNTTKREYLVKVLRDYPTLNWKKHLENGPFPRRDSAGEIVFKDRMWLLGGYLPKVVSDVWSSADGDTWEQAPDVPTENGINIPVTYVHDGKMWVASNINEIYSSADGKEWKLVNAKPPWAKRYAAGGVVFKGRMWVLGGMQGRQEMNDIWSSTDGVEWKREVEHAPWSPRQLFGNVVVKDGKMWIIGGGITNYEPFRAYADVWNSEDGIHWKQVTERAPWPVRIWNSSVVYRNRIFFIGGFRAQPKWENRDDIWYSANGKDWQQLQTDTIWPTRHEFSPYIFKDKLWIVAGNTWPLLNDVWSLDIPKLSFLSQPVQEEYVGTQYNYFAHADFNASAEPVRYRLREAPKWLKVDAESGRVSGTPAAEGEYKIVLEAFDKSGEVAQQTYTLYVQPL